MTRSDFTGSFCEVSENNSPLVLSVWCVVIWAKISQHMRAHDDPTALAYSFHDVVTAGSSAEQPLRTLQSRCLEPGKYAQHLKRWLLQYRASQMHIFDGMKVKYDPVSLMNRLQRQLKIQPFVDYSKKIRYVCPFFNHFSIHTLRSHESWLQSHFTSNFFGRGRSHYYPDQSLKVSPKLVQSSLSL